MQKKPKYVWKIVLGIILCCYGFGGFLAFIQALEANQIEITAYTLALSIACVVGGIFFIVWAMHSISSNKEKVNNPYSQFRVSEADAYYQQKVFEANQYFQGQKEKIDTYRRSLQEEISSLENNRDSLINESIVKDAFPTEIISGTSDEIKNKLIMLRQQQSEMIKNGEALTVEQGLSAKERVSQSKQLLRCFGAECSVIIDKVTIKNADASRERLVRAYEALNRIFSIDGVQLTKSFLQSKLEELNCACTILVRIEEEKEQRRAIREQMVEEEKVRKEIEREKQKIEKEEAQFSGEISKLMAYMQKAKDEIERKLYLDKIDELQKKLEALQKDKDNVLQREQNTRAGFVYIISNIGSFGEQVFKIGMTRRLEPMDRISELSSASVPFPFDVHALIFSDDAPALEAILHQHFDAQRVNRVNPRKEFFRVDLDEIKKVVLENHNATVKFVDIPDATEYRESLKLSS